MRRLAGRGVPAAADRQPAAALAEIHHRVGGLPGLGARARPVARIIVASYSDDLARRLARDFRRVVEAPGTASCSPGHAHRRAQEHRSRGGHHRRRLPLRHLGRRHAHRPRRRPGRHRRPDQADGRRLGRRAAARQRVVRQHGDVAPRRPGHRGRGAGHAARPRGRPRRPPAGEGRLVAAAAAGDRHRGGGGRAGAGARAPPGAGRAAGAGAAEHGGARGGAAPPRRPAVRGAVPAGPDPGRAGR